MVIWTILWFCDISNKNRIGEVKMERIFGTIISSYFGSNWFRNSFSNAISGVLLLCIFIPKFYTSVKTNYKESK